jgi:hypothetical protein
MMALCHCSDTVWHWSVPGAAALPHGAVHEKAQIFKLSHNDTLLATAKVRSLNSLKARKLCCQ